jgi:hypothetical protein
MAALVAVVDAGGMPKCQNPYVCCQTALFYARELAA